MTAKAQPGLHHNSVQDIIIPVAVIFRHYLIFRQFLQRAIARRYRLSAFGLLWTVLVPLFTLAIYTLVFGVVLQSRWAGDAGSSDTSSFGLYLFSGLIVFWLMADVVGAAPSAIVEYTNLVKKAVFPLEVLPLIAVGSAVFHALISTAVLLAAILVFKGEIPGTAFYVPLILFPFVLLLMGFGWLLSAIGVFFRDIQHIVGLLMTGVLFLSPIFYSIERLGPALKLVILLNPVTFIVTQMRAVLLDGASPNWLGLALYFGVAWLIASTGLAFFRYARKSFADVL
ncbi:MAG: ABC transporter permease [Rhodospirillaceae bacterium]